MTNDELRISRGGREPRSHSPGVRPVQEAVMETKVIVHEVKGEGYEVVEPGRGRVHLGTNSGAAIAFAAQDARSLGLGLEVAPELVGALVGRLSMLPSQRWSD